MSWCRSLMVMVPLQFEPKCRRAHTAKSKPAAVSAAATLSDDVSQGRKRSLSGGRVDSERQAE
jgi:hypothetical protein